MNLRVDIESDLSETLEDPDGYGLPIILIAPDGTIQTKSENDADQDLSGQILYDSSIMDPETGLEIVVDKPVITLRRTSLTRIPAAGEKWFIRIPERPDPTAPKSLHSLERPPEHGKSIGFIRLYLTRAQDPT